MSARARPDGAPPPEPLYAPFRPRRARSVAVTVAAAQFAVLAAVAFAMPATGVVAFRWYDRLGMLLVAAAVAWVLLLFARLAADPDEHGLRVRNLVVVRRLEWAEIVAVHFRDGDPWVTLDLADGDVLAVMAVQRADGPAGIAEARRLAALVARHGTADRPD